MKTLRSWQDVINEPIKIHPITAETLEFTKKNPMLFRGSVRRATGRVWIDKEFEKQRKKILSTHLP